MVKVMHAVSVMNRAGQETFIMNLYRTINRDKVQFGFQCSLDAEGDFDEEIRNLGGELFFLGKRRTNLPILKYFNEIVLQYRFFKKHSDYEIFHIHTYHALSAVICIVGAKMAGVNKVFLHSHNTFGMHPILHKFLRFFVRKMEITKLACSFKAAEWMYGKKDVKDGNVKVIKNGIFPKQFRFNQEKRNTKRKGLQVEENCIIGHIGRFNTQKNHEFLIDVFQQIKGINDKAILLLIGTGELEDTIREKVISLGLQDSVKFMGTREDINELLWIFDLFLFPSLYEGLSVVAIEAQAAGVPILAADTLVPETKVTDCLHFFPLDKTPKEWAERALALAKIGHADSENQIRISGYDMEEEAKKIQKLYLEM